MGGSRSNINVYGRRYFILQLYQAVGLPDEDLPVGSTGKLACLLKTGCF